MDFNLSPQEEAFKQELCDWLDDNTKELPEWWSRADPSAMGGDQRSFRNLADGGIKNYMMRDMLV